MYEPVTVLLSKTKNMRRPIIGFVPYGNPDVSRYQSISSNVSNRSGCRNGSGEYRIVKSEEVRWITAVTGSCCTYLNRSGKQYRKKNDVGHSTGIVSLAHCTRLEAAEVGNLRCHFSDLTSEGHVDDCYWGGNELMRLSTSPKLTVQCI